ncbi:Protein of unknown function (DUF2993) [Glaciihabitans tibetensis]|uniref:DUF2993 family protein n=1 Tax=Glaciihabitans tibetensis TaxID=1266600 RepID=A0A2T0VH94_9MICO|nr:DUF2993 domain-containing protein [Glaciihabitans tibetensis]PRY69588.1 Protein of unknown function (DUF2993) [Glaciihabitans tibetensis]
MAEPDEYPTRPYPADEQPTEEFAPLRPQNSGDRPDSRDPRDPRGQQTIDFTEPAPKRKRKWGRTVVIVLVVLALLLVIGYLLAERWVRGYASDQVKAEVVTALELPSDDGVDVDFGPASMLLQVLSGSINDVELDIEEFTIGELTGSANVVAHDVPLAEGATINDLTIDFAITEENLGALVSTYSAGAVDDVGLDDGMVSITTDVDVLAFTLPVTLGLVPSASGGDLVFTPESVMVNGAELTVDEVADSIFGPVAGPLLEPRSFCVAAQLPESLVLAGVEVTTDAVVLTLDGEGTVLTEEAFAAKGSC